MPVHVVIKRKFKMNNPEKLFPLLNELNNLAKIQEGYISTDTLQSTENNEDYLVISKWTQQRTGITGLSAKREEKSRVESIVSLENEPSMKFSSQLNNS